MDKEKRKKAERKRKERHTIKDHQKNLVRFVEIKYMTFKRVNGKNKADKLVTSRGLQIENTCYLENGKRKLMNASKTRIIKKYDSIPEWATDDLIKRFEKHNGQ